MPNMVYNGFTVVIRVDIKAKGGSQQWLSSFAILVRTYKSLPNSRHLTKCGRFGIMVENSGGAHNEN